MLARLAATLRERQAIGGGIAALGGDVGEGTTIVLDENCNVSLFQYIPPRLTLRFRR